MEEYEEDDYERRFADQMEIMQEMEGSEVMLIHKNNNIKFDKMNI